MITVCRAICPVFAYARGNAREPATTTASSGTTRGSVSVAVIVRDDVRRRRQLRVMKDDCEERAVLGTGTTLTARRRSTDVVRVRLHGNGNGTSRRAGGSRRGGRFARIARGVGKDWGISLYTPVIIKYRDAKTDSKIQLEDLLR